MHHRILASVLTLTLLGGVPLFVGCDRNVEHKENSSVDSNGNVKKETKDVTKNPDGTTTTTEKKDVQKNTNP